MFNNASLSSDIYQYTMGKSFVDAGTSTKLAIFNVFFQQAPDNNGFAVVSGINEVLEMVKDLGHYPAEYYKKFLPQEHYNDFCYLLAKTKFTGTIRAMREGEIAWPNQPIIKVIAPLLEAQLLETPLLCIMNHAMAVATKASRVVRSTKKPVAEFGSRRAHGLWAAMYGGKAAYIAGCTSTSNILDKIILDIPCTGTMAHSYVTSFGVGPKAELQSFKMYIATHPKEPAIMLIDTYDTLKSGCRNAIRAFKEMGIKNDYPVFGVRLDSGDLCYLSKECRKMLDAAGYTRALIFATNGLDEYLIPEIEAQGAEISCYGVGDAIATARTNPCFGNVYKLTQIENTPVIKLSEDPIKITNPGNLITLRVIDKATKQAKVDITCIENDATYTSLMQGYDLITMAEKSKHMYIKLEENSYSVYPLQTVVMKQGEICEPLYTPKQSREYHQKIKEFFDASILRLTNPHLYKVNISDELYNLKMNLRYQIEEAIEDDLDDMH